MEFEPGTSNIGTFKFKNKKKTIGLFLGDTKVSVKENKI